MTTETPPTHPIVIFDGECNLCNFSVDFLLRNDRSDSLRFAANQGDAGRRILERHGKSPDDVTTLYLYEGGTLLDRSTAVLRAVRYLRFPYPMVYGLIVVPRGLRNWAYEYVAARRYRWFGKRETCRLPTPDERERFLP